MGRFNLLLALLLAFSTNAQPSETRNRILTNAEFIKDYTDLLSIKFFGIVKSNRIRHFDNFTQRYFDYKPNENFNLGLGVNYKWFGLDLAVNLPFVNDDNELFGKTKRFDFQANLYLRKYAFDINLQSYEGYFGYNPQSYDPGFDPMNPSYPIRPDIKTSNFGINATYIFKEEAFTYRGVFTYNERQLRSKGSWLLGAFLSSFTMDADSTLIPFQVADIVNPNADFRGTRYVNLGIGGGYAHTFIIGKRVFFSLSLTAGFGPSIKSSNAITESKAAVRGVVRAALGYSSDRFYAGISGVNSDSSELNQEEAHLARSFGNFKIFFGRRFNAPKFLK